MDAVLRALAIYLVLMLLFRLVGKRSLAQITTFDFVLILVVGEATQQALLGEDFSITNAALVIATAWTACSTTSPGGSRRSNASPRACRWWS
jgi:uncharacterized membrane protein YcaP (DUF421 family)